MVLNENNYQLSFEKSGFKIFSLDEYINFGEKAPQLMEEKVYTIIWSGTKKFSHFVNGIKYELPKNTFLYLSPNVIQLFKKQVAKSDGYMLLFKEEFYAHSISESLNLKNSRVFSTNHIGPIKNTICNEHVFKNVFLKPIFHKNYNELERKLQRNIIERIILNGQSFFSFNEIDLKEEDYDVMIATKFLSLLQANVHQEKLVLFYTDRLFVTKRRLDKATVKVYNKTAKEMIVDELINKAKIMLLHTNMPIKDIALELNFLQETNFTAFFKKNEGISPSLFRQNTPN